MSHKLPGEDYHLDIPDSKVTDCSEWGPIDDGKDSSDEEQDDNKSEAHPESIDIKIPTQEDVTERSRNAYYMVMTNISK